jgi:hypothetical protein
MPTVLGSIPASSDTVESEGAADAAVLNTVQRKKSKKSPCFNYCDDFRNGINEKPMLIYAYVLGKAPGNISWNLHC